MATGLTGGLGIFWRKLIIIAARRVHLNSPFMCVFFTAFFVLTVLASRDLWTSFDGIALLRGFHGFLRTLYYLNRFVQLVCSWLAFTFFARMLQICYPKYYEHLYDRFT